MATRRAPEPGDIVAVSLIVLGLGADVWLIRHNHEPITHSARKPLGLLFIFVFVAHVLRLLGWADPFSFAARRLTPRRDP